MRVDNIRSAVFDGIKAMGKADRKFDTGGLYSASRIFDVGSATPPTDGYRLALNQGVLNQKATPAPGVNRPRVSAPALARELLWGGAAPPAAHAPLAIVVSGPPSTQLTQNGRVWQGQRNAAGIVAGSQPPNNVSIGLVIQFNDFLFYTAGDLPTDGEDLLAAALIAEPLPDATGAYGMAPPPPPPPNLAFFKCGHHGSKESTSAMPFLNQLNPSGAVISCGLKYGFPDQPLVDRLQAQASITHYYLTNCLYPRTNIPASASPPGNQLAGGNRSRVAGDNNMKNRAKNRHRGDIHLSVTEAASLPGGAHQYTVSYWELQHAATPANNPATNPHNW